MRRIFIALALIAVCISIGTYTRYDLINRCEKHLNNIKKIEYCLNRKDYNKAEKICKKTADEYTFNDSKVMYNYYNHSNLSDIGENFYSMRGYIKRKKDTEFYYISGINKNKLQNIIDKEPINLRNIL